MQTEKQLQDYLRRECLKIGASFDKVESRSRRGFPDCLIIYRGQVVFVELKSPAGTGKVSALQQRVIFDMDEHGAQVYVIDSVEEADELIYFLKNGMDVLQVTNA